MKTQTDINDQYFDIPHLSTYSCLGKGTIRDYLKTGMPHYKLKGKILVKRSEFDKWMEGFKVNHQEKIREIVNEVMADIGGTVRRS